MQKGNKMERFVCPICLKDNQSCTKETNNKLSEFSYVTCNVCHMSFNIADGILVLDNPTLRYSLFNLIFEFLILHRKKAIGDRRVRWFFYYDDTVPSKIEQSANIINLYDLMRNYPSNVIERTNRSLLLLSVLNENIDSTITKDLYFGRFLFCTSFVQNKEIDRMLEFLSGLGYIDCDFNKETISLTFKGWQKVIELSERLNVIDQGFIAMSYAPKAKYIMEAFREAIVSCEYSAQIISEKEHNHQIVPEMFFEIERSKFMVVDVTYQNYGAYYEAGYAQALGKEVIVCCSEEVFNDPDKKPHFDISQKPIIIWKDIEDLKQRLKRRIEATVR